MRRVSFNPSPQAKLAEPAEHRAIAPETVPVDHPVGYFWHVWQELLDDTGAADRARLFPDLICTVLPDMAVFHRLPTRGGEPEYRLRLWGSGLTRLCAQDWTGATLKQFAPASVYPEKRREMDALCARGGCSILDAPVLFPDRSFIQTYRGLFAFHNPFGQIDQIFLVCADTVKRLN